MIGDLLIWSASFALGFAGGRFALWLKHRNGITPQQWRKDNILGIAVPKEKEDFTIRRNPPVKQPHLKSFDETERGKWVGGVWIPKKRDK